MKHANLDFLVGKNVVVTDSAKTNTDPDSIFLAVVVGWAVLSDEPDDWADLLVQPIDAQGNVTGYMAIHSAICCKLPSVCKG